MWCRLVMRARECPIQLICIGDHPYKICIYYIILVCTVWYYYINCIILYYIILYYILLYYIILYCIILYYIHFITLITRTYTLLYIIIHTIITARCISQPQVFRYVKSTAENSFWAYVTVCFQSLDVRSTRWKSIPLSSTWDVGILGKGKSVHIISQTEQLWGCNWSHLVCLFESFCCLESLRTTPRMATAAILIF